MKRRALIVDDEEAYRIFLTDIFERAGYQATTASNGIEALDLTAKQKFDVIVTDMVMPGMEGKEFIAQLRNEGSTVPIIAITGYVNGLACLEATDQYHVNGVIYKPFAAKEVLTEVERVMQGVVAK
jgi:CheY-like chemotaxis protein